jgi:hypothetical protein
VNARFQILGKSTCGTAGGERESRSMPRVSMLLGRVG